MHRWSESPAGREARAAIETRDRMTPILAAELVRAATSSEIEAIGAELRRTIAPVLEAVAGVSPRPTRISRAIGLDKSLASRLVRAVQSSSDLDLMHLVPSPGGLRIFADLAARYADPASIANLLAATERFEQLLDTVPGGRASIDAQISESSQCGAAQARAHRQAGVVQVHVVPARPLLRRADHDAVPGAHRPNGRRVDGIEIQRRIGLRRMRPSTPLVLMSVWGDPDDAVSENAIQLRHARRRSAGPATRRAFLLSAFCTPARCRSSTSCARAR